VYAKDTYSTLRLIINSNSNIMRFQTLYQ